MPLFSYSCGSCKHRFETLLSAAEAKQKDFTPPCPRCGKKQGIERLLARFRIGGQGDLRESTLHGCHDHDASHTESED